MSEETCIRCGKDLSPRRHKFLYVNYDNQTGEYIKPDAAPEHGEFGCQPIGSDCARKLPSNFIIGKTA